MKKYLFLIALLMSFSAQSSPFVQSDPTTENVTDCLITVGNLPEAIVTATVVTGGKVCKYDLASIAPGPYVVTGKWRMVDPIWGSVTSNVSAPFSFTKPNLTAPVPTGFSLIQ